MDEARSCDDNGFVGVDIVDDVFVDDDDSGAVVVVVVVVVVVAVAAPAFVFAVDDANDDVRFRCESPIA